MEIRHADLQIEVEDAEDGGVLLTIIDSARLSLSLPRKTAEDLLSAIDACMKTGERQTTDSVDVWTCRCSECTSESMGRPGRAARYVAGTWTGWPTGWRLCWRSKRRDCSHNRSIRGANRLAGKARAPWSAEPPDRSRGMVTPWCHLWEHPCATNDGTRVFRFRAAAVRRLRRAAGARTRCG